jgi:heme/copper-type cytochrome/quinol oxidase subunit 4
MTHLPILLTCFEQAACRLVFFLHVLENLRTLHPWG